MYIFQYESANLFILSLTLVKTNGIVQLIFCPSFHFDTSKLYFNKIQIIGIIIIK